MKSERTIRRMLKALHKDGELQILTPGIGRDTKRLIHLERYVKPATTMTYLNRTASPMRSVPEQYH
jgi:hypothetical protein